MNQILCKKQIIITKIRPIHNEKNPRTNLKKYFNYLYVFV